MDQIFDQISEPFLRPCLISYAATIALVTHPFSTHMFSWELVCRVSVHRPVHRLIPLLTGRRSSASRGLRKRPTHVVLSFLTIFIGEGRTTHTRSFRFYIDDATARAFTTNYFLSFFWILGLSLAELVGNSFAGFRSTIWSTVSLRS